MHHEDFPSNPVVKTVLPLQGTWVQSLVGELRSYMLYSTAKRFKKRLKKKKKRQILVTNSSD